MPITRLTEHDSHQMSIHINSPERVHYASLRCLDCKKHIQWLSVSDVKKLDRAGISIVNRFRKYDNT